MSKEQRAKSFVFLYLLSLLLTLSPFLLISYCSAVTPQEEYKKIQKEIKEHREKLRRVQRHESSILSELERTNRELGLVEAELRKYREKLKENEREISRVESEISKNKKNIEQQKEWIKRKLRAMQRSRYPSEIVILLSGTDDLSLMMRKWKYLQYISSYENKLLLDYKKNLEGLNLRERQLLALKAEIIKNEAKIKASEEDLAKKKRDKEVILASVRNEKESYEKMLKELKEASKRLLEIIKKSEKDDKYYAKGFNSLKGRLPWPVEGRVAIPYGSQKDPRFNTPVFRSGIFIQSGEDLYAKAVHTGKVVFAEWFKGYGQLMIVNHGDGYHTLYGSLSEIFSKVGDIINTGQIIGRVGNSGILDVPGLYFELRYKGKPLDPLQWLKRK